MNNAWERDDSGTRLMGYVSSYIFILLLYSYVQDYKRVTQQGLGLYIKTLFCVDLIRPVALILMCAKCNFQSSSMCGLKLK